MKANQHIWQSWAAILRRWGMHHVAATLLEAAGPLTLFGAQIIYLSQPLLKGIVSGSTLNALSLMLEDPQETREFTTFLREASRGT